MTKHYFHLKAQWPGSSSWKSNGYMETGNLQTIISISAAMDGPGIGTRPDEMFLGSVATSYLTTLTTMVVQKNLPLKEVLLQSIGIVDVKNGVFAYEKIIHRPTIILAETALDEAFGTLDQLVEEADRECMISRAIRGNVEVELQANIPRIK